MRIKLFISFIVLLILSISASSYAVKLVKVDNNADSLLASRWQSIVPQKKPVKEVVTPINGAPKNFTDLVKNVSPSVVNISTTKKIQMRPFGPYGFGQPYGRRDPFDDFFEKFYRGIPEQHREQRSLGSGFIIDDEGLILTNNHVVQGADEVVVRLSDEHKYDAKIIGRDDETDLAVIKINTTKPLPTAELGDSDELQIGDWVVAIGNPFGLTQTVTAGIVSAKGRIIGAGPYDNFIQTDASINPGNSGGPLFNMNGEVVGINTAIFASGQGLGFAIPINMAKKLVPQLVEHGKVKDRGWLGVLIQGITPELAKSFGLPEDQVGALIGDVVPNSPAAEAGLKRGDVIIGVDGKKVNKAAKLPSIIATMEPGREIEVEYIRKGKKEDIKVILGNKTAATKQAVGSAAGTPDKLGLVVRPLNNNEARELNIEPEKGVFVQRVEPGSAAENGNVRTGDVIYEINNDQIDSLKEYEDTVDDLRKGSVVRLLIYRKGGTIFLAFKLL